MELGNDSIGRVSGYPDTRIPGTALPAPLVPHIHVLSAVDENKMNTIFLLQNQKFVTLFFEFQKWIIAS